MTVATRAAVQLEPLLPYEPTSTLPVRGGQLPAALNHGYGSDLAIPLRTDRSTVIANFVSTLDGVVSYNIPEQAGGGEISGFFEPDRLVMGLLRSLADAVVIGAGTLRAAPSHQWTPTHVHRRSAAGFQALRASLRLSPVPTTVVVTASGDVDLAHRGLADADIPVMIVTTDRGQAALRRQSSLPAHVDTVTAGSERVDPSALIEILGDRGMRLVLTEGGPHLFGQMVGARLVDELFLTIAPQVAGRASDAPRLGLVEGTAFAIAGAPWSGLVDVRRSGNHLFTRYRFQETAA